MTDPTGGSESVRRRRTFSLAEAQTLLPSVVRVTERAVAESLHVQEHARNASEPADPRVVEIALHRVVQRWSQEIEAIGGEPKGLWLVDFDSGMGYYCWRYPERRVDHWHPYDTGIQGRLPIQ